MKAYQNLYITGSIDVTGSGITGSLSGTASFSTSASYATSASLATSASVSVTASYADAFQISGSLTVIGSSSIQGTASFTNIAPITQDVFVINNKVQLGIAQRPSVNANYSVAMGNNTSVSGAYALGIGAQNFIANGANATFVAGQYNTASALFQTVVGQYNAADNTVGAFIVGGGTGTEASARKNTAVFTTSSITLSGSVDISGSLLVNGVAPGAGGGGATVTITGSKPSGSVDSGSLWWNSTDGNLYIQVSNPTGSSWVPSSTTIAQSTNATSASFATTASYLDGAVPTYLKTDKNGTQSIPASSATVITGFGTPSVSQNAGEWNGATGVFTATKSGVYSVTLTIGMDTGTWPVGSQIAALIFKNGSQITGFSQFTQAAFTGFLSNVSATTLVSLAAGNTLSTGVVQLSGAGVARTLLAGANSTTLVIQELPSRITR